MAIAYVPGSAVDLGSGIGNTFTASFTAVGGVGHRLVVCFSADTTVDSITGVTYAGTAMLLAEKVPPQGLGINTRGVYLYYLDSPATGANNVVISRTSGDSFGVVAAEYSGVQGGGVLDNHTTNSGGQFTTTSLTTVADNCWTVLGANNENSSGTTITAGAGLTLRIQGAGGQPILFDSAGPVHPAGAYSMTTNSSAVLSQIHAVASFAPAASGPPLPSHVQGNSAGSAAGGTTQVATLPGTVGIGNMVCGAVSFSGSTLTSVTDDKGNVYVIADALTAFSITFTTFYRFNITNAPQTITANFAGSSSFTTIVADEYSGISSGVLNGHVMQSQASIGTGANAVTSGNILTTINGALIYGATANDGGSTAAAGTGFAARQSTAAGGNDFSYSEDLIQTSKGSIAATFTDSVADNYITAVMAFASLPLAGSPDVWLYPIV